MESDLPWVPGAVRAVLLADVAFSTACHNRVATTRAFSDVTLPFGLLRVVVGSLQALGGGGYKVDVQLDAFCPEAGYGDEEPEPIVWRIANRGVRVLQQTANQRYQTMHWSVSRIPFAGPLDPDDSRDGVVLYRAAARAELAIHNI